MDGDTVESDYFVAQIVFNQNLQKILLINFRFLIIILYCAVMKYKKEKLLMDDDIDIRTKNICEEDF